MAIAFVTGGVANGNAATSSAVTISPSSTGGTGHDMFVAVSLATGSASVTSITATGGTATFKRIIASNAFNGNQELWAATDIGAGITSITVNFGSSKFSIAAGEYSGIAQWGATGSKGTSSSSTATIVGTPVRTGSYLLCAAGLAGAAGTYSAGTATTIDKNGGNGSQSGANGTKCNACLMRNTSTTASSLLQITVTSTISAASGGVNLWIELCPTADTVSGRVVQAAQMHVSTGDTAAGTSPLLSVALRTPVVAGHLLVGQVQLHDTGGVAITLIADTDANTWVQAVTTRPSFSATLQYAANTAASATFNSVTETPGGGINVDPAKLMVLEYSGAATSSPLDKKTSSTGTSTSPSSGATANTTQLNELVVGFVACEAAAGSIAAGSGYTSHQSSGQAGSEDQLVTSSGAQTATFTLGTSGAWACLVATFIDAIQPPIAPPLLGPHRDGTFEPHYLVGF